MGIMKNIRYTPIGIKNCKGVLGRARMRIFGRRVAVSLNCERKGRIK